MESFRNFFENIDIHGNVDLEQKIIDMYHNNATIENIRQETNASTGKIYRTLENFGIKKNRHRKDHNMIRYYKDIWNLPTERIAQFTKYSPRWVREILKRENHHGS